jgi:hypothetical protein
MLFSTPVKRTRTMFGSACRRLSASPALLLSPEREHSQQLAYAPSAAPRPSRVRGLSRQQAHVRVLGLRFSPVPGLLLRLVRSTRKVQQRLSVTARSRRTEPGHGSVRLHLRALGLSASLVSGHEAAAPHSPAQARLRRQPLMPHLVLRFLSATVRSPRTAPGSGSDSSPARVRALSPRLVSVRALAQRLSQVLARASQPEPLSASARSQEPGQGRSPRLARFRFALRTVAASLPRQARPRHPRRRAGMPARLSRRAAVSHRRAVLRSSGRRRLETFARRLHSRHLLLHGRSRSSSDDRSMRSRSVARGFAVFRSSVRPCSRTQSCSHAGSHLTPRSSTVSLTAMQPARSSAQPKRTSARRRQSSTFASRSASFLRDFGKHQEPSPRPRSLRVWFRPTRSSPPRSSTRTERLGQPHGFTQTFSPRTHPHARDSQPAVFPTGRRLCVFRSSPPTFQRNLMLMASSPVSLRTHSF